MPELPEIETIRRDLSGLLQGVHATAVFIKDRRLLSAEQEKRLQKHLLGREWEAFHRRGKYLLIALADGWTLVFHLRMTGQIVVVQAGVAEDNYRARFVFNDGRELRFYDVRRFGTMQLLAPGERLRSLESLGPEPLSMLDVRVFTRMLRSRTTRVQPLLMDQRFLAGIGNIYAQEALFKAGIRPSKPGRLITHAQAGRLFAALQSTLEEAIKFRGSTSRDYRDALGMSGSAQTLHTVYRRGGLPCSRCEAPLKAGKIGGRGTVYCPSCQR